MWMQHTHFGKHYNELIKKCNKDACYRKGIQYLVKVYTNSPTELATKKGPDSQHLHIQDQQILITYCNDMMQMQIPQSGNCQYRKGQEQII